MIAQDLYIMFIYYNFKMFPLRKVCSPRQGLETPF